MKTAEPGAVFSDEVKAAVNYDPDAKPVWCGFPGCDRVADPHSPDEYCKYHATFIEAVEAL